MHGRSFTALIASINGKRGHPTQTPGRLLRVVYALVAGILWSTGGLWAQAIPIDIIDYYGLRTVSQDTVSQVLGLATGDTLAIITGTEQRDIAERLEGIPGVEQARVGFVCCTKDMRRMLYVGIAEEGTPQFEYRTPPDSAVSLPQEIIETHRAWWKAGDPDWDESQGYLSSNPEMHAIEERLIGLVEKHQESVRQVLRYAADAQQRKIAAWVIAYASDKRTVVEDLLYAASDPDYGVRNNAILKLDSIAHLAQDKPELGIQIPPGVFIPMLNSFDWTDRNKALALLETLTKDRDAAVLAQLRQEAFPALVEMARWQNPGHAVDAYRLLCRVAGLPDEEIDATWKNGEKEAVIARIAESEQTK